MNRPTKKCNKAFRMKKEKWVDEKLEKIHNNNNNHTMQMQRNKPGRNTFFKNLLINKTDMEYMEFVIDEETHDEEAVIAPSTEK